MQMALGQNAVSSLYNPKSDQPVKIVLSLPENTKTSLTDLKALTIVSKMGQSVPITDLVKIEQSTPRYQYLSKKSKTRRLYCR